MKKIKQRHANTVHIAGRGSVVRQLRPEASIRLAVINRNN